MLDALRTYLAEQGYESLYVDFLPGAPSSAIGLFGWGDDHGSARDGTVTRYVQIQCRAPDAQEAHDRCAAIGALLDSGCDEAPIPLPWNGTVIGTLRRGPLLLNRTETDATYSCEVALWGLRDNP